MLLGKGASVLKQIANDAVHSDSKMARIAAILDLAKIGGPPAITAVQNALVDADSDVRVIAWDALVELLGLTKSIQNPDGVRELTTDVEIMRVLLASEIGALVKVGADGMRDIATRLSAGATAQQLGIAWCPKTSESVFDKLRAAIFQPDSAFPIDEIAKLNGPARMLAETMIARLLEDWDERVPDALVKLDAAWTAPALAELASSDDAPSELQEKLAEAARALQAS